MNKEIEKMCIVNNDAKSGPSPIPEDGKWIQAKEIKDISGLTHGVGWCAPQQGACKLTLNIKNGIIEEAKKIAKFNNVMKENNCPVILDVTHSLQQPNQSKGVTGGLPHLIEPMARAGVAVGVDGLFIETHQNPSVAKSDGANMLRLDLIEGLLTRLTELRMTMNKINAM